MSTFDSMDSVLASATGTRLTLGGLHRWLHITGRLGPLVREALAAGIVQEHARQMGLTVSGAELQTAADDFRRRQRLISAAETRDWLAARGLTAQDFESSLEQDLLAAKLREHFTGSSVDAHFASRQTEYDRLGFVLLRASREDLARELASQIQEEGRDLASIAAEQGLRLTQLVKSRQELGAPLRRALESAKVGQLVGPVATPDGFLLVLVEEIIPGELDTATRKHLQEELFGAWLAGQLQKATINRPLADKS